MDIHISIRAACYRIFRGQVAEKLCRYGLTRILYCKDKFLNMASQRRTGLLGLYNHNKSLQS